MDVKKVALLANLPLTPQEEQKFAEQFVDTLKVIDQINELDTAGIDPTSQVTGLVNVMRKDVIDNTRILKLNRYFVIPAILHAE